MNKYFVLKLNTNQVRFFILINCRLLCIWTIKLSNVNGLLMHNVIQLCLAANNILLMHYVLVWKKADRFASQRCSLKNKLGDQMIKQLLNSVITKYCDLPVSRTSIICLSLRLRQIIDLLTTDKLLYFAQPRPIIVNYLLN